MGDQEAIAKVVRDIRAGNYVTPFEDPDQFMSRSLVLMQDSDLKIVDVSPIYDQWMNNPDGRAIYEDHTGAPPWGNALLCYQNAAGNVTVMHMTAAELDKEEEFGASGKWFGRWQPSDGEIDVRGITGHQRFVRQSHLSTTKPDHTIDWDAVKWGVTVLVFGGGRHSSGIPVPTTGPLHMWRMPVYPDGEIGDLQWTVMDPRLERQSFDNAMMVLLETLTMCNCANVVVAVPERKLPRHERRRLERIGVKFSEIHIRPTSKAYRGNGTPMADLPKAFHGVRGSYHRYGPEYGRGLLFGKYAGRFWVPPHVRGSREAGEVVQTYIVGDEP